MEVGEVEEVKEAERVEEGDEVEEVEKLGNERRVDHSLLDFALEGRRCVIHDRFERLLIYSLRIQCFKFNKKEQ